MKQRRGIVHTAVLLLLAACSSGGGTGDNNDAGDNESANGISIEGVVADSSNSLSDPALLIQDRQIPSNCPDDETGLSLNLEPVEGSFRIATRYVRLLKEGGDDYYEIPDCTHATAAAAEAGSVNITSTSTTICSLEGAIPEEAVATFDGMEIAIYYVQMTVPMIIPYLATEETNYPLRVYFNDDGEQGILARDILVYSEADGKWGWINYTASDVTFTDEGRPAGTILDAFSNDDFWCADCDANPGLCPAESERRVCSADSPELDYKDPVTISTRDTSGGTNFALTNDSFVISADEESFTLSMSFDLADTLTVWENADDVDDATHTLDVSRDCGFHPLFPSVTIADE